MKKQIANIITGSRILFSIWMLFCPACSACFYVLYLLCGLTDMVDGTVARMTGAVSGFGSKLDTAADIAFMAAACVKWLPLVELPAWLWVWIAAVAIVKTGNAAWGIIRGKNRVLPHTAANKITGFLLFLMPLTLQWIDLRYSAAVVCVAASLSAVQEGCCIKAGGETIRRRAQ